MKNYRARTEEQEFRVIKFKIKIPLSIKSPADADPRFALTSAMSSFGQQDFTRLTWVSSGLMLTSNRKKQVTAKYHCYITLARRTTLMLFYLLNPETL